MASELEQLRAGIAALESQRALLGDTVADAALQPLRARLGELMATRVAGDQTLRQVTILLLDVVGSTTLSEHLDPEDVHAVLTAVLSRSTALVEEHGGTVLRYAGDSLLAVFGYEAAREDDPERAVRAGLALVDEGRTQGEFVEKKYGRAGVNVRVGLHTGTVLLGTGVRPEEGVHGIAVSIAARMEQTAPPGSLRISRDTYRHVRGLFDVQPQPAMKIKGLDTPFVTYLVLGAKEPAFRAVQRGVEGIKTPLVGRDEEVAGLRQVFASLFDAGKLSTVLVTGEAGVGKSRLLYEFESWTQTQPERCIALHARATQQGGPYSLLRAVVASWLQLDSEDQDRVRQQLEQGVAALLAPEVGDELAQAQAHLLGHLVGFDFGESRHASVIRSDVKQLRDRGFHAAAQLLRQIAARERSAILLLLEDLHWADEGSLEFLAYLSRINADVPLLIVALARPVFFERFGPWPGHAGLLRIDLSALDRRSSSQLAHELLKKLPEVPEALSSLLVDGAEGNPFYMEELVNMLMDKGAIEADEELWTLHPERLIATAVPQTLTGVVQARLDALPATERLALQEASVIGFVFWEQALASIDAQASWSLPALVQRALTLQRQDPTLEGMREYAFRHQILHHVTYDTVLNRTRRELHAKVATWLEGISQTRQGGLLGLIAMHHDLAGARDRAAEFYARAAEYARERYAHADAHRYVDSALAVVGDDRRRAGLELRWRLLDVRERTLNVQAKREVQDATLVHLRELAEALDDDRCRAEVSLRVADRAFQRDDMQTAEALAKEAIELAARVDDPAVSLRAQGRLSVVLACSGHIREGKRLAEQASARAREAGLAQVELALLSRLGYIASLEGKPAETRELSVRKLKASRELEDRGSELIALCACGFSSFELGDHAMARRYLEESLHLARSLGDRSSEGYALKTLSDVSLAQDDDAKAAAAMAIEALRIAEETQSKEHQAGALFSLGNAQIVLDRLDAAVRAFEQSEAIASEVNDPFRHDAAAGRARVALASGDHASALVQAEHVWADYSGDPKRLGAARPVLIQLTCWQAFDLSGQSRANAALEAAHAFLQERAGRINDARLRQAFLSNIPEHRAVADAWNSRNPPSSSDAPGARSG